MNQLYTVWGKKIECKQKDVNKDPNEHLTCQISLPICSQYYNMFTPLDVQKCKTVLKYAEKWENRQCFFWTCRFNQMILLPSNTKCEHLSVGECQC